MKWNACWKCSSKYVKVSHNNIYIYIKYCSFLFSCRFIRCFTLARNYLFIALLFKSEDNILFCVDSMLLSFWELLLKCKTGWSRERWTRVLQESSSITWDLSSWSVSISSSSLCWRREGVGTVGTKMGTECDVYIQSCLKVGCKWGVLFELRRRSWEGEIMVLRSSSLITSDLAS